MKEITDNKKLGIMMEVIDEVIDSHDLLCEIADKKDGNVWEALRALNTGIVYLCQEIEGECND